MGRGLDLERLALGRSAFQDAQPDESTIAKLSADIAGTASGSDHPTDYYEQQYDAKGRPINVSAEARNQALRNAQNSVLALVGVVESDETTQHDLNTQKRQSRAKRDRLLKKESERGELLDLIAAVLLVASTWWPELIVSRIQAGAYSDAQSFGEVISQELTAARCDSLRDTLGFIFTGLPASILCHALRNVLHWLVEQGIGHLQGWLNTRLAMPASRRATRILAVVSNILLIAVDAALLPLQYHAITQKLALASPTPLLPALKFVLPGSGSSAHNSLWSPGHLGLLASPAALILLQNLVKRRLEEDNAVAHDQMAVKHGGTMESSLTATDVRNTQRPFAWICEQGYRLKSGVLKWLDWKLQPVEGQFGVGTEIVITDSATRGSCSGIDRKGEGLSVYRSTAMSHHLVQYLGDRIDDSMMALLTLPLDSLVLRTVAQAFFALPLAMTAASPAAASKAYVSVRSGPVNAFGPSNLSFAIFSGLPSYVSKLGLSLAMTSACEIGVFFVMWQTIRWQGIRQFAWGKTATSEVP